MVFDLIPVHFIHIQVLIEVKVLLLLEKSLVLDAGITQRFGDTAKRRKLNILLIFEDHNAILFKSSL